MVQHQRRPDTILQFVNFYCNVDCANRARNQVEDVLVKKNAELEEVNDLPSFQSNPVTMATYDQYVSVTLDLASKFLTAFGTAKALPSNKTASYQSVLQEAMESFPPFQTTTAAWKAFGVSDNAVKAANLAKNDESGYICRIAKDLLMIGEEERDDQERIRPFNLLSPRVKRMIAIEKKANEKKRQEAREKTISVKESEPLDTSDSDGDSDGCEDGVAGTSSSSKKAVKYCHSKGFCHIFVLFNLIQPIQSFPRRAASSR